MEELDDKVLLDCVKKLTGIECVFAHSTRSDEMTIEENVEKTDFQFQLMPKNDYDFFNWYTYKFENEQWYNSKTACAFMFNYAYLIWVEKGKQKVS